MNNPPLKPGPRPGGKIGTKEVTGKIIGRDKQVVPPEEVFKLAQMGCKDTEIADWFGVNGETLRYNFRAELLKGRESLKQSLRQAQINLALSGNAVMLIWLGKNLLGQSDNPMATAELQPLPWISGHKTESENLEISPDQAHTLHTES
jgi:hypothetical protein